MPKKRKKSVKNRKRSAKNKGKRNLIIGIIFAAIVIILVIIAIKISKTPENAAEPGTTTRPQTSSDVYTEVKSDNAIFSIDNDCVWSGTDVRCKGVVRDTETKTHETSDIYIDLIAFDNEKKCGYCNSRINLGKFSIGVTKRYSLVCDIGKKADILAKVTVSARASQIFNGC